MNGPDAFENRHELLPVNSVMRAGALLTPEDHDGVDGVILEAEVAPWPYAVEDMVAYGYVFGDKKGRFYDGKWIHTAKIIEGPDENGVIRTKNSAYRLKMKPETTAA